jgi:phospholipase/carboxylesterase
MTLAHRARPAVGEPGGALVLLHGRGADELDLFPLLDVLDPDRRLVGLTPRAPLALPPGGAHWYIVREIGYPDPNTFLAAVDRASHWLDSVAAENAIPLEHFVLGGFSQGAVMSYALGLGRGRPSPAALIAFSGFLPTVEGFELDLSSVPPVAIGHGTLDPVIEVGWGRRAHAALEAAGAEVNYRESPLPHAIDLQFAAELAPWIVRALDAASARPRSEPPPAR